MCSERLDTILIYCNRLDSRYSTWLTGAHCRSTHNYLVCTIDSLEFIEVHYHAENLKERSGLPVNSVLEEDRYPEVLASKLKNSRRIGILGYVPVTHIGKLDLEWIDCAAHIDPLLWLKSAYEIKEIRQLALDSSTALEHGVAIAANENLVTEKRCAALITSELLTISDFLAFPISIVSGDRLKTTTLGAPSLVALPDSSPFIVDFGTVKNGLFSDQTSMHWLRPSIKDKTADAYLALKNSIKNSFKFLKHGALVSEYREALEHEIASAGLPIETLERNDLGHGIGFGLHEGPFIGLREWESTKLSAGMVLCIEPELIIDGNRIRHEEMVNISS
jgi:Xaa-Pro aminopeptidase